MTRESLVLKMPMYICIGLLTARKYSLTSIVYSDGIVCVPSYCFHVIFPGRGLRP